MHKYAIISIRAVECRKVVKNSNLWLASLSQLFIFMQIIIFSWQHSCSDILYFAQYMQSIYCKRGALQHPKHNTYRFIECIQSVFTFPIHLFIMQIFFRTYILMCRLYHIQTSFERWAISFFIFCFVIINEMAMLFAKRDELIYLLFEFFVCFIAFDSTLKWVKIEFFIKGELWNPFSSWMRLQMANGFFKYRPTKKRVMNVSLSAFGNQICASSVFGTYRSLLKQNRRTN